MTLHPGEVAMATQEELREALAEARVLRERFHKDKKTHALHLKAVNPDMSNAEIGRRLGVSDNTVKRWLAQVARG